MNYKCKSNVGPWTAGTIITDADLKANPGLGGVARLRDKLQAIEDTTDEPGGEGAAEVTTGNAKLGATTHTAAGESPNASGRRGSAGKS